METWLRNPPLRNLWISVGGRISQLKAPSGRGLPTTSGGGECVNGISVSGRNLADSVGAGSISARNVYLQGSRAGCHLSTHRLFQFSLQRKLTKKSPSGGLRPPKGALPPHGDKNSRAVFDFWRFVSPLYCVKRIYLFVTSHTKGSSPYLVVCLSAEILNYVKTLAYATLLSV